MYINLCLQWCVGGLVLVGQYQFVDYFFGFEVMVCFVQVCCIDWVQQCVCGVVQFVGVYQVGYVVENVMLFDYVVGVEMCLCEYEFLVDVDVFGFVWIVDVQCVVWFYDQFDMFLWCQQVVDCVLVVIGIGQIQYDFDLVDVQCLKLWQQWLVMVDYMVGVYLCVLCVCCVVGGGGDYCEVCMLGQLDCD